jgi:glycosyltransferase involved in cell wall biosynthesis
MRIATYPVHAGSHAAMAATGHEFVSLGKIWPDHERPRPANWVLADRYEGPFDLGLAFDEPGLRRLVPMNIPLVYAIFIDMSRGRLTGWVDDACELVVFTNKDTADRWELRDPDRKRIVEFGIEDDFPPRKEGIGEVMTVGNFMTARSDKGIGALIGVDSVIDLSTYGAGNSELRGAKGFVSNAEVRKLLAGHKVYFNSGPVICNTVAEAMMAGTPVVTMEPETYKEFIHDGVNGFVAKNVEDAVDKIRRLLVDPGLRETIGSIGRKTALERFAMAKHISVWNAVFGEAVASAKEAA